MPTTWLGAIMAILRKVNTVFIDFQQIQTDDIGGLVLCHDKMLMDHHGSQGKEIGFAHRLCAFRLPRSNSEEEVH